jgi:hypothetical protein
VIIKGEMCHLEAKERGLQRKEEEEEKKEEKRE